MSNAPSELISPHFSDEGWQSPPLHLETLFRAADSEVSVDLTVQAANLLSEKFSSQAKKLINLSKSTVQSALEIQQRIVMPRLSAGLITLPFHCRASIEEETAISTRVLMFFFGSSFLYCYEMVFRDSCHLRRVIGGFDLRE